MTVTLTSSLRIGLVSATGVNFNAPLVPQITTDDIFAADNPSQNLTDLIGGLSSEKLAGTVSVDGTQLANHAIYTVPAGDVFIPTKVILYLTGISGSGNPPIVSLGWTAPNYRNLIDDTVSGTYSLMSSGNTIFAGGTGYTANDVLTLTGGTHSVVATVTVSTVDGSGVVTAFTRSAAGTYTVIPTNSISVTGGTGTGFKLNGSWSASGSVASATVAGQLLPMSNFATLGGNSGLNYVAAPAGSVLTLRVPFVTSYSTYAFKAMLFGFISQ